MVYDTSKGCIKKKVRIAILTFNNISIIQQFEIIIPQPFLLYPELFHPPIQQQPQLHRTVLA